MGLPRVFWTAPRTRGSFERRINSSPRPILVGEVIAMPDHKNPFTSPELSTYFDKLPRATQEAIEQSGVKFESVDHLRDFIDNLNHKK